MDATRLPPPVAEAPATVPSMPTVPGDAAATIVDQQPLVNSRFQLSGIGVQTPTGLASDATDVSTGSAVVLKMVAPEVLPTQAMADRALRELKQLAKVTSDRIVRVVDQGRTPDGQIYVATERVEGAQTLDELVERSGPLPVERAKQIVLQVGEALTEAQKVGVIHRDVAPRNILVAGDRVKVGDFGLAEPISERIFGAPAFLSPEQAEGKPVDQRSNIYSLGAVYYFALTGKARFAGDTTSLMQQHLSATPAPPSSLRPEVGADIDRVILKALEKSGGRRHLTLRQLLTEVGGASSTGPQQQVRAGADAKTVMGMEAPQIPARPQRPTSPQSPVSRGPAQTIMGIPGSSPVGAMGPGSTAPSMPAQPQAPTPPKAAPQAATVMAEAPQLPSRPQPSAPQPSAPQPPAAQPSPASVQPTMMAEAPRAPAVTPAAPAPAASAAAPPTGANAKNATGKKGAFRETAWFKRGEIEEEMAKAQASVGENALKTGTTGMHKPIDESQVDLSAQDHARLSLKTGATQAMPVIKAPVQALPGERMDEEEMLAELNPSRKYFLIAGGVVVLIVIAVVIYFATRSAPSAEAPTEKPAPVAAAPPTTPPATATTPSGAAAAAPTAPAAPPTTTPPPTPKPGIAAAKPTAPPSPSLYAAQVAKAEASGDKKEAKKLEKLVTLELKTAKKKKERDVEEADRELLARLKKLRGGK